MRSQRPRFPVCSCPCGKVLPPTPSPITGFLCYCLARCRRGRGGGDGNGAVGSGRHWRNPCWRLPSNMGRGTWMQKVEGGTEDARGFAIAIVLRSEEHASELQSLMRISYAVFCLKKKNKRD